MTTHRVVDGHGLIEAMAIAVAGDIISVAPGTYALPGIARSRSHGTKAANIVVTAETPNSVTIDSNGHEEALWLGHPYWRIEHLIIRASGDSNYGIKLEGGARFCVVRHCSIDIGEKSEAAIKGAGASDPRLCPDSALIEDNLIVMTVPTRYSMAEGVDAVACNNWLVRNNVVRGIRTADGKIGFGIMIKGNASGAVIERNVVSDCFINISLGGGGTGAEWMRSGIVDQESRSGIIRGNVLSRSRDVGIYLYSATGTKVHRNWIFESSMNQDAKTDKGTSIDVRMTGRNNDIAMNYLDKPIKARDGGLFADRSNCYGPSHTLGVVRFSPK